MKFVLKTTLVALAALAFAGCQKKTVETTEAVKLRLHYYKQENVDGLKNIVKAFEKTHPGVTIELQSTPNGDDTKMQREADVGNLPDIIQMASYARVKEYASRGLLEDLTEEKFMSKVIPSSLPAVSWSHRQYAVPMDYAGIGIIYNKDIFNKYGIQPPETFSQLQAACNKLKANGVTPFTVLLKENWSMGHYISMIHTMLLAERGINPEEFVTEMNAGKTTYAKANTDTLFKMMDYYRANMNSNASSTDGGDQQKMFANGQAAMMVQGLWAYVDALKINPRLNAGFIPYPVFNNAKNNVFFADVDSCFAISSQCREANREKAYEFMNWLTSAEGQKEWMEQYKLIPPMKGVNVTAFGGPYVDLMHSVESKGSIPWAFSQYPTEVFDGACKAGAQAYMLQKISSAQVIKNIDDQWKSAVSK